MKIDRSYKPWLLTPGEDSRPVLECALVERIDESHGALVVADGFTMGVFDVLLEPDEKVGLVKASYLKYARSVPTREAKSFTYSLFITDDWVVMPDGSRHPQRQDMSYPEWRRIMPALDAIKDAEPRTKIGLTPFLLDRIVKAMGLQTTVQMRFTGKAGVFIVTADGHPRSPEEWSKIEPPFALLMPAHAADDPKAVKASKNGHDKEKVHA